MNYWTQLSYDYANQKSYLDDLFKVYPTIPEGIREIDEDIWENIADAYKENDNLKLIQNLLQMELFPIKDSYVSYLRKDSTSLERNPATVDRLAGRIYEMGLNEVYKKCTEPKETNRQIGPLFSRWLHTGALGVKPITDEEFLNTTDNAILSGGDAHLRDFAVKHLGFITGEDNKGVDLVARFNGEYVIGEAKFLTDFGGHQNAQFNDALNLLKCDVNDNVHKIAILDGVLYLPKNNKMCKRTRDENKEILSSLVLREYLYQI